MGKGYYVGLDMGTGSVGWAVTDESYQILRRHGKAMWGVRLFESAKTAEERRMFRTGRRRLDRRGWRIEILQEIFAEEISRVDPGFFLRMKESKYYPEDKRDIQGNCPELPYTLFVDKTFTDKDFHKKYPTIYHLRKMLMETEDTPDIRLVYLALHHMMKHRGHFLLSGDISQVTEFKNTFNQFIENIRNEGMDFEIELDESAVQMIEETLKDKNLTRSAKKAKLVKGLNAKNVRDKAFLTLLSGGTVKLSDLFGMEELNEGERPKISFADNRYEEYAAVVEMELGELYYIVESAKAVYDWAILSDILGGSTSVSDAKVRAYEKHKADLKYLKAVVKEYFPKEVYNAVFVESSDKLNNYPAYIGMTKKNGKKVSLEGKRCSREEFMDFLKKNIVVKLPDKHAKNRGAKIYGEIVGYGATSDAYHITSPDPEGEGAAKAIHMAIEDAGITPDDIDYINAHGTGTPYNDAFETIAIKKVFGDDTKVPVSSTKSMTGHLLGAAGGLEAVICAKVLTEGFIPPTVGLQKPDPELDLDYVPNEGREADVKYVLSNSLGFGGHNGTLIMKKYED